MNGRILMQRVFNLAEKIIAEQTKYQQPKQISQAKKQRTIKIIQNPQFS